MVVISLTDKVLQQNEVADFTSNFNYKKNMSNEEQNGNFAKPMLPAGLSDADYIKELEGIICFLAGCYDKTKEIYFDKHMNTCSVSNPNRRDLTDAEQSEWQRFPMIQGTKLQHVISNIAKANKPNPNDVDSMMSRFVA